MLFSQQGTGSLFPIQPEMQEECFASPLLFIPVLVTRDTNVEGDLILLLHFGDQLDLPSSYLSRMLNGHRQYLTSTTVPRFYFSEGSRGVRKRAVCWVNLEPGTAQEMFLLRRKRKKDNLHLSYVLYKK